MNSSQRLVFLQIETTGTSPEDGHRIIEISALEYIGKQPKSFFHHYLNPEREISPDVQEVHGLSLEFLQSMPLFADIADDLQTFLAGATVVAHNALFDVRFLDQELNRLGKPETAKMCLEIVDTLKIARKLRPSQNNSMDALCHDYGIDTLRGTSHNGLLDLQLLAQIYMAMIAQET